MKYYYYKGEIYKQPEDMDMSPINRGFLYGDGFFETMKYSGSSIYNEPNHKSRIERSSNLLGVQIDADSILNEVKKLLGEEFPSKGFRLRITFFRSGKGLYNPKLDAGWEWLLTFEETTDTAFVLNEKGLKIGKYLEQQKAAGKLANIKSISALLYVQAAEYASSNQLSDVLIVNTKGNIIESSASNIFAIKSGYLFTPALSEGPVAGTMRARMLQMAFDLGLTASSGQLNETALLDADEIWLSNAIKGIQWVEQLEGKTFRCNYAPKAVELLNKELKN